MNAALQLIKGLPDDQEWLYGLFRSTMKQYIASAWGWDEQFQKESFNTSLSAANFRILTEFDTKIGGYHLSEKSDHIMLDMILVEPGRQRQGHGLFMMETIQQEARARKKPIQLSVLKTNPAIAFHKACGYITTETDSHSVKMQWHDY
ncbi:MAG: GNAT superfamily N-acetyltransferase [Pseudohongiellaceae bacterium]|jgi:GNAT superfamily N-acetyltransferase